MAQYLCMWLRASACFCACSSWHAISDIQHLRAEGCQCCAPHTITEGTYLLHRLCQQFHWEILILLLYNTSRPFWLLLLPLIVVVTLCLPWSLHCARWRMNIPLWMRWLSCFAHWPFIFPTDVGCKRQGGHRSWKRSLLGILHQPAGAITIPSSWKWGPA